MRSLLEALQSPQRVLCLGAHCDDVEIGCSGAIMRWLRDSPGVRFHWVVFSGSGQRESETRAAARRILGDVGSHEVEVLRFRESYFPQEYAAIKDRFEALRASGSPDLVLTHHLGDRHQDHRTLAELTWNTFRDHTVLEYEIAKYEGDLGHPNVFVPLEREVVEAKIDTLMTSFPSQHARRWFEPETFRGLMRLRGVESNAPSGYAEAFHARKLVL